MQSLVKKATVIGILALSLGSAISAQATALGTITGLTNINTDTVAGDFTNLYTFSPGVSNNGVVFEATSAAGGETGVSLSSMKLYFGGYTDSSVLGALTPIATNEPVLTLPLLPTSITLYVASGNSLALPLGNSYTLAISGHSTGASAYTGSISVSPVPEPETYGMLLAGMGMMGVLARRKKNKPS